MTVNIQHEDVGLNFQPGPGLFVGADPDYQLKQAQVAALDTFKGGLPTDAAGNPDYAAMAKALYAKGAFGPANELTQTGLSQQLMRAAQSPSAVLGGGGGAQPAPSPAPSASGFSPEVSNYIIEGAKARGINPNLPLRIFGAESKLRPTASGDPDATGQDTSFGVPQLHYGGGTGPNSVPGMGDDFTKATGLDARDPKNWKATIDFALDAAAKGGWGPWHAAQKLGIPNMAGIGPAPAAAPPVARPVQVAQNGASDAPDVSGAHPYAPASPSPAASPGAQDAQQPQRFATPYASNGSNLADPTLGGLVSPEQLQRYGSYGGIAKAAAAEAASLSANPYAKGRVEQLRDYAKEIMSTVSKAQELTTEQKNSRDPLVVKNQTDLATLKATARANAMTDTAGRRAEQTQEGEALGKIPGQLAAEADSARSQNSMIDEMLDASRQFSMGKFADKEQALNSTMSALGHKLGVDTTSIDGKVAAYEDFGKLAGQFSRQAMKEAGGRAGGIQELRFITNTLPSPTMSQAGFEAVANQLKGLGEFKLAKQQAGEAWLDKHGSMRGFDTSWNQNVSPSAFVMHRLQVEQPEVFSTTVSRLAQSAPGRAALQHMRSGMAWAGSAGLLD